jgi:hypothetical protein
MSTKEQLLEELRRSRAAIARDAAAIAEEINLASKIKKSVLLHPLAWLSSATALGYILAGPKTRVITKLVKGQSADRLEKSRPLIPPLLWSLLLALFKFAFPLARPALTAFAMRRLAGLAMKFSR